MCYVTKKQQHDPYTKSDLTKFTQVQPAFFIQIKQLFTNYLRIDRDGCCPSLRKITSLSRSGTPNFMNILDKWPLTVRSEISRSSPTFLLLAPSASRFTMSRSRRVSVASFSGGTRGGCSVAAIALLDAACTAGAPACCA